MDLFQEAKPRTALALPPRTVLNDVYEVGRVLGKGGFGITYAALDQHLQVPVAIKEFLPAQVAGRGTDRSTVEPHGGNEQEVFEHGLKAFLEEARTLAQFNHPNIVQVRAFFRQYGTGYLVMPYYEGRTLDAMAAEYDGPMPASEALEMLTPVLDGLEAVHAANLLHRDIKPQNIYLTHMGDTILLDFGAARIAFGQESQSLSAVLTPGYAPFEQYSRRGHQGPWTDVYATAATLYRLVTGQKPPEATDRMAGEPLPPVYTLNPAVPPAFSEAVATGLAVQPKDRPESVAAFRQLLNGAMGGDKTVVVGGDETVVDDGTLVDDGATVLEAGGGGAETIVDEGGATAETATLVLKAEAAVRYRLDGSEIQSLDRGATREVEVTPGRHTVSAAFGRQRRDVDVSVAAGARHVVTLTPPPGGGAGDRGRQRDRDDRPRSSGLKWILGGLAVLVGGAFILILALSNNDDFREGFREGFEEQTNRNGEAGFGIVGGDDTFDDIDDSDGGGSGVSQHIVFQGQGAPYVGSGTLAAGDQTLVTGEFTDMYTFDTGSSNLFFIEAFSTDVDPYLILQGPSGQTVAENDDFDGDLDVSYIEYHVDQPGTYRLLVTTAGVGEVGEYNLTVTPDFVP